MNRYSWELVSLTLWACVFVWVITGCDTEEQESVQSIRLYQLIELLEDKAIELMSS